MDKKIWTYWHQGFSNAPYVVKQCIQQLQKIHPEATIHLLDAYNVYEYADAIPIANEKWRQLQLPHKSDLLRTQLLIKYGGVWLDPTVFCMQPLDTWLPDKMNSGLFLFHKPGKDRIISNWFIASEQENYLLEQLYKHLVRYWNENDFDNFGRSKPGQLEYWTKRLINGRNLNLSQLWLTPVFTKILKLYPYMIYHFMFYRLIKTDPKCREIYNTMPKVSADGPHTLSHKGLLKPLDESSTRFIDNKEQPLQKLKWKLPKDSPEGTILGHLFSSHN